MQFLAIDFETANVRRDSACAVGIARVEGGQLVASTSYLIQPPGNEYDSFNIGIHGITPDMTSNAATFVPVLESVLAWADGLPLVAHNASFDMSVLRAGFESNGRDYPQREYCCSLLMSRAALPGLSDYKLPRVHSACGGTSRRHHDAKADAEACAEIVLALACSSEADTLPELSKRLGMRFGQLYEGGYRPCRCVGSAPVKGTARRSVSDYVCNVEADQAGPFFDADVAFTGELASMERSEAMRKVADRGGRPRTNVSKLTEYVVVGHPIYEGFRRGVTSAKIRKALELIDAGHSVQILSEPEFLDLLGGALQARRAERHEVD